MKRGSSNGKRQREREIDKGEEEADGSRPHREAPCREETLQEDPQAR